MLDSLLCSPSEVHWIASGSNVLHTLRIDSARKDRSSRRSITSKFVRLVRNINDQSNEG